MAGSGEARALATLLSEAGHTVVASLAGATKEALRYDCKTITGGFGGAGPFETYVTGEKFEAVIDATHPFADRISARTSTSCNRLSVPYVQLLRPPWVPEAGDIWHKIAATRDARSVVLPSSRVFLATGRQTLSEFANLTDCYLICRQIDPPDGPFPFPNGEFLIGRPPFTVEDEVKLFGDLRIDVLVVKNAGGAASRSKLDAARILGIPVVMISRPAPARSDPVETIGQVMDWVARHADH